MCPCQRPFKCRLSGPRVTVSHPGYQTQLISEFKPQNEFQIIDLGGPNMQCSVLNTCAHQIGVGDVAHFQGAHLACMKPWVQTQIPQKLAMLIYAPNPNALQMEEGGPTFQIILGLYSWTQLGPALIK